MKTLRLIFGLVLASVSAFGQTLIDDSFGAQGTAGAGFLQIANQSSAPSTPTSSSRIYFDSSNRLSWKGTNGFVRTFDGTANTADRVYVLPNVAGTVALTFTTLTSGRVPFSTTGGILTDSSAFTFTGGDTLTVPKVVAGSVTSTAGTALTLATGTSGTALTFASATNIATFGANIVLPDGGKIGTPGGTYGLYQDSGQVQIQANSTAVLVGTPTVTTLKAGGSTTGVFSSTAGIALTALGTNQSITLTPSGTGTFVVTSAATDPFAQFNSTGTSAFFYMQGSGVNKFYMGWDVASSYLQGVGARTLDLGTASLTRIRIASGGNLLIGGLLTDGTGVLQFPTGASDTTSGIGFRGGSGVFIHSNAANQLTITATGGLTASGAAATLYFNTSAAYIGISGTTLNLGAGSATALSLDSSQNATFAGAYIGSTDTRSGPGAVSVTKETTKVTTTGALDALTLANGADGQTKIIVHDVDGGSFVLTPATKTGWTTFTSTVVGETITLKYVTTRGWMVIGNYLGVIAP